MFRRDAFSAIVVAAALMAVPGPALAVYKYTTEYPFWKVGKYDHKLSQACKYGRFNLSNQRVVVRYRGDKGFGGTSVGLRGWNIRDPDGLAADDRAYHFWNSGYSDCRVYIEVLRPRRR